MEDVTRKSSRRARPSPWILRVLALLVVAAAVAIGVLALVGDSSNETRVVARAATKALTVSYPSDWRRVNRSAVPTAPKDALAVLKRTDGKGIVIVRADGPAPRFDKKFTDSIDRQLKQRLPDYRLVETKIIQVRAGKALYFSYVRKTEGTLRTITVIPAGSRSYVIDTISNPNARDVAKQLGEILRSATLS